MSTVSTDTPKPLIQRLREKYDYNVRRRKRLTATFDELIAMFIGRGMSNEAVAKAYNMAVEPVRLCRMRYIDPILGQTGQQRYNARRRELPCNDPILGPVAFAAEEAGLTVRRVHSRGVPSGKRQTALLINGHLCSVHFLKNRRKRTEAHRQQYVWFCFRRETWAKPAVRIFYVPIDRGVHRIFVVPAFVFNRRRVKAKLVTGSVLLEPRKRVLYIPGQIDWHHYENAWHLLDNEEEIA